MRGDPLLNAIGIVVDRVFVFLALTAVSTLVQWSAVWERGLGRRWLEALAALRALLSGTADRTAATLFTLTAGVAVLAMCLLCAWLFARWRCAGEPRAEQVRGTRMED